MSVDGGGVIASSYLPDVRSGYRVLVTKVSISDPSALPDGLYEEQIIEITPNSALYARLATFDNSFFPESPVLRSDGRLELHPTGCFGTTALAIEVLDLADVNPDTGEPVCRDRVEVSLSVASRATMKRPPKDVSSVPLTKMFKAGSAHAAGRASPASSLSIGKAAVSTTAGSLLHPLRRPGATSTMVAKGNSVVIAQSDAVDSETHTQQEPPTAEGALRPPGIRAFRNPPPRVRLASFGRTVFRLLPTLLLRQMAFHTEYVQLAAATGTQEQAVQLLRRIQTAMNQGQPVEGLVPLVDAACRLHTRLGGAANLKAAVRLAHLRVNAVGTAMGIDMQAAEPVDAATLQRLSSSSKRDAQTLFTRALVESAHLLKRVGHLEDSLRLYKIASLVAGTLKQHLSNPAAAAPATTSSPVGDGGGGGSGAGSQVPFLMAAADVHMLRGELDAATTMFERARAHAELMSRSAGIVSESEQMLAAAFTLAGKHAEADIAMKRCYALRRDPHLAMQRQASSPTNRPGPATPAAEASLAEACLYDATCAALRGHYPQAAQHVVQAREHLALAEDANSTTSILRASTEVVAGCLQAFCGDVSAVAELDWNIDVAQGSPCALIAAFAAWIDCVHRKDGAELGAVYDAVVASTTDASVLASLVATSRGAVLWDDAPPEALVVASVAMRSLELHTAPAHPLLPLAAEVATVAAHCSGDIAAMTTHVEKLVGLAVQEPAVVPMTVDAAFRVSACVAEATTSIASAAVAARVSATSKPTQGEALRDLLPPTLAERCDTLYARLLATVCNHHGTYEQKVVPILLDGAEVRYVRGDYTGALELFARALRIVDSKNILYLVGPLLVPQWLLSPAEVRDRDRLGNERSPGITGFTALAMLLQQVALCHEAMGHASKAVSVFEQSVAVFEMAKSEDHPGFLAALVNLSRCHLTQKEHASARLNLERADDVFYQFFYRYGRYLSDPLHVDLRCRIDAGLRAAALSERAEGSLLAKAGSSNPELRTLELYV